ncbi:MAG: ABC transporter ATP-binding protein, partial [Desulfobacterales bacterium]|nr:ABC transporter ATP-binding protein [Desulfobacterales bacterium]
MKPLLEIQNLKTYFHTQRGIIRAVDEVSLTLNPGEILGVVGESGCGKSVTAQSIMGLIPMPPGRHHGGSITFDGQELLSISPKEMNAIRGNRIAMIFQEPMTSLNPVKTIGYQIGEMFRLHRGMTRAQARKAAVEMLEKVQIPEPAKRVSAFPHQMSGGMR